MKRTIITTLLVLAPVTSFAAEAVVPEKAALCTACHGEAGAKPIAPTYPVLAGQYGDYLAQALHEYKAGTRKNAVMGAQAAMLSDDEIKALADYFSLQDGPLYTPSVGDAAAK
ncbi:cytochrome c [Sinimarinibacterium sp. CAU 1509]|uniref:c-type cytochrome n=1 Tax=Sinimarinibacterium sp. CAU 1509 TaxID=2562283 RepID=UPI0010AC588E|nr:cytochrome c [Sinimarinibacterium sp. CAU 1509]TJY59887.1 cytochrome c [Sinimarinibacterium sp. CAU 1509]